MTAHLLPSTSPTGEGNDETASQGAQPPPTGACPPAQARAIGNVAWTPQSPLMALSTDASNHHHPNTPSTPSQSHHHLCHCHQHPSLSLPSNHYHHHHSHCLHHLITVTTISTLSPTPFTVITTLFLSRPLHHCHHHSYHHCQHTHLTVTTTSPLSPPPHHCQHHLITVTTPTSLSPPRYCHHHPITVTTILSPSPSLSPSSSPTLPLPP